ncbi:hypothetical protein [Idiomarina abyssalis]|uniref:hypothetical protein n=1 Tax=Idiomarina abyssalis TaxID=86102 RepID=UPI003A95B3CF
MIKFKVNPLPQHNFYDSEIELVDRIFYKQQQKKVGFYRRMFDEDFSRLFHHSNNRSSNLFNISSNDDEFMKTLFGNIHNRRTTHQIDEIILELVTDIAQSLIWYGKAYYLLQQDVDTNKIHTISFSSQGVISFFGKYIQWVPRRRKRHNDQLLPREIRVLDSKKVMRFDMPIPIKHMLSEQNRTLAVLDQHQYSEIKFLTQAQGDSPSSINYFNFSEWNDIQELALYRATKDTGWNCRKYDSSKRSDFFDCHRLIRFRRNQLTLRDQILNQLSNELSRVGKVYNPKFSINISSSDELPSIAFLNELEVRLEREDVSFDDIIDYCNRR